MSYTLHSHPTEADRILALSAHYDVTRDRFLIATGRTNADADMSIAIWCAEGGEHHTTTICCVKLTCATATAENREWGLPGARLRDALLATAGNCEVSGLSRNISERVNDYLR